MFNYNINNNNINSSLNSTIGSLNSNSNNTSNISNINLTPQRNNQITSPLNYNQNNSNNSPLNPMISQPQNNQNQTIYINPKLLIGNLRQNQILSENEQDINLKEESSEIISEESLSTGRNIQSNQISGNTLNINKNPNEFINNKYLQQQNTYIPITCNMNNNINNNSDNIMNNNLNNIPNMQNYNKNLTNQINNSISKMNNLNLNNIPPLNNYQRQFDNQNNKLFNSVQIHQNYPFSNKEELNLNHSSISQKDPNFTNNNNNNLSMNLGNIININYNGSNTKFIKNQNNMNINNKMSLSSQGLKNTKPFYNPGENLNFIQSQPQQIPSLINLTFNPLNNRNFYVQQNIRNPHMNNNYNNNHINNNNNIFNNNYNNNNFNHNNIGNNNKKYQKEFNFNNSYQKNNEINNYKKYNNNKNYKKDKNNNNFNNNNLINNYNYNLISSSDSNKHFNKNINFHSGNKKSKQYMLCLHLKLGTNKNKIVKIKSLDDCDNVLKEIKKIENINEIMLKLIEKKIYEAIQITQKIYGFGLNKYTYKNLAEISNKMIYKNEENIEKNIKRNHSCIHAKNNFIKEMDLSKNDVRKIESLNISF